MPWRRLPEIQFEGLEMPSKKMIGNNVLSKKLDLLFEFRGYSVKSEVEKENFRDIAVVEKGEKETILVRVVYKTRLISGKVGVLNVRGMKKNVEEEGYVGGILIGRDFSYSARKESKAYNIEVIPEKKIPSFNIFDHHLVPKQEVLPREEAEGLLKRYHVEPHQLPWIKVSDPAVFLIGAKPGDILKITRESPTAGAYVTYRYVV